VPARYLAGFLPAPALIVLLWLLAALLPDPSLEEFLARPYSLTVTDRHGTPLDTLPVGDGVMREFVPLDEVPALVLSVLLGSEDERFHAHPGVDPAGIVRAAVQNARAERVVSGASTITMQLARLVRPHTGGLGGKLREALYALRLEAQLPKDRILELWINSLPFGYGAEGVASAARRFFGVPLDELTTEQTLMLAVIPRRPSSYNPILEPEAATDAAYALASRINVAVSRDALLRAAREAGPAPETPPEAPHFIRRIDALLTPERRATGVPVRTTLDLDVQRALTAAIRARVESADRFRIGNGAGLALDTGTGEVLAYVGSADFSNEAASGQIDGVRITRQPGSTLKPFLYALALENGFTASTVLPDVPLEFGGEEIYVPENFSRRFTGPVRLRTALASSLNVPAVYTLERIGVARFADYLIGLGFQSLVAQRDSVGTGLALGNAEVSLLELVRAFTVFVRGGTLPEVRFTGAGEVAPETGDRRVMERTTSALIQSILSDKPSRVPGFGTRSVLDTSFEAIFKTGTSNQFNNIWALGSNQQMTVGVWMGNFGGETVIGAPGSSLPAAVVTELLARFTEPGSELPGPEGLERLDVCATSGLLATEACPAVLAEYFVPGSEPPPCSWHTAPGAPVRYPPEYQSWARDRGYLVETGGPDGPDEVTILRPADGAVFYLDPTTPRTDQAVPVEAVSAGGVIQLFVDDALVAEGPSPLRALLPLRAGRARIVAVNGTAVASRTITVR
jgi:penicillin-binding protein 1C